MKKHTNFVFTYWRTILGSIAIIAVLSGLLGYGLGTITSGYSEVELRLIEASESPKTILENPLYAPQKLLTLAVLSFTDATPQLIRSVSVFFGALSAVAFFYVIRRWYSARIAFFGSLLLVSSSWFLHVSRLAAPLVMYMFGSMVLLALGYLYYSKTESKLRLALLSVTTIVSLYTPGMIWLVIAFLIVSQKEVLRLIAKAKPGVKITIISASTLLIAPLIYAIVRDTSLLLPALALPDVFMPLEWLKRLFVVPIFLFAQGPFEPEYNLGRLPLLGLFSSAMVLLGLYAYSFKLKLMRSKIMPISLAVTVALVALNGPSFLPYLIPSIFIVITAGVALLLQQWFTVFPKNPIARGIGVAVVVLAISITSYYHIYRYFVAWGGNPATQNSFIYSIDD